MYDLSSGSSGYFDDYHNSRFHALDIQCKQRLLISCYLLDQQHATLFGRQMTTCFAGTAEDLPFPRSQLWWDAIDEQQRVALNESHVDTVSQVLAGLKLEPSGASSYDTFQSMLLVASSLDMTSDSSYGAQMGTEISDILSVTEQSLRLSLATHTFQLCKLTPIRDLLAVAGESWVMAEKLGSQAEYTAAQIESRQWAKGNTDPSLGFGMYTSQTGVDQAMEHALKILEIHRNQPKTGLLFQEWAVYLASVVIWARAYVTSRETPQIAVPNSAQPRRSSYELEQAFSMILAGGANSHIGLEEAMVVLLWSKVKIERVDIPHNCGITNGALDVLGKLITRGSEDGWFGS